MVYILDELLNVTNDVDIEWGNHNISWMGAASGNRALFMLQTPDDNIYDPVDTELVVKMYKAITVIQLKPEGQLIERYFEWNMDERDIFLRMNFDNGTVYDWR